MQKKKNTFIFNLDWVEILRAYPAEVRYEVYDAIIMYAQSGTLSELKPLAKMAFDFIKKEMDYNNDKYAQISASRSAAGKQGGAPAGNDNAAKTSKTSKISHSYMGEIVEKHEMNPLNSLIDKNGHTSACNGLKTSKNKQNKQNAIYDNDNDNNISLSLTPSHEVVREDDGVTAVEKERFF